MKKLTLPFVIICGLAMVAFSQADKRQAAPRLELKNLRGKTVRLSDLKGKVVLLNFWAVWCGPCAAEIPELLKWHDKHSKEGLQIVGITYPPTNLSAVRNYVKRKKMTYSIWLGSKATKRLFDESEILPVTVIIDRDGNIAGRIDGIIYQDEFDTKVIPILEELPSSKR